MPPPRHESPEWGPPIRVAPYVDGPPTTPTSIPTDLMSRTGQLRTVEREADDLRQRLVDRQVELDRVVAALAHQREEYAGAVIQLESADAALAEERETSARLAQALEERTRERNHLEGLLAVERARGSAEDLWPRPNPPERPQRPPERAPRVFDPPRATREDLGDGSVYAQTQAAMRARFTPIP